VRAGRVPDREAMLAAHPDLADELRSFFADRAEPVVAVTPTMASGGPRRQSG
jgi:hypothetical protein